MPQLRRAVIRPLSTRDRRAVQSPPPAPVAPEPTAAQVGRRAGVVDAAIYQAGRRQETPRDLPQTYRALRETPDGMAWVGLYRPTPRELRSLAAEFDLHELAVEDAIQAHQRPKLERYGDTLFVVLRAASYRDDTETVEFGELHLFIGPEFVVTVRHSESPDLSQVRRRLETAPELLGLGTDAVLYAILDAVVDGYAPVVAGLENDIDEIETAVFHGDSSVSRRIYELSREVIEFQRAVQPLRAMLTALAAGYERYHVDEEIQAGLRDVADHVTEVTERVASFRVLLRDILTVNATLVAERQNAEMQRLSEVGVAQNEEVKRISAWAAILFAPTLIGTVYGMNFEVMPELKWQYGYPFAIFLMGVVSAVLYTVFRRRDWI